MPGSLLGTMTGSLLQKVGAVPQAAGYLKPVFLRDKMKEIAFFLLISRNIYSCTCISSVKYAQTWSTAPHNVSFLGFILIHGPFLYFEDGKRKS